MKKIRTSTAAVAQPTLSDEGTEGYFRDGNPGSGTPATKLSAAWFNDVQQELVNVIGLVGDTGTDGEDQTQLAQAVLGARAINAPSSVSNAPITAGTTRATKVVIASVAGTATGSGTNAVISSHTVSALGTRTAVVASQSSSGNCRAIGVNAAVVASDDGNSNGTNSLVTASDASGVGGSGTNVAVVATKNCQVVASGDPSGECAIVGAEDCTIDDAAQVVIVASHSVDSGGTNAFAAACDGGTANGTRAVVIGCEDSGADGGSVLTAASFDAETDGDMSASIGCHSTNIGGSRANAVLLASKNAELARSNCVALGYHATTKPSFSDVDHNLTVALDGVNGDGTCDGAWTGGGADYAEMFENATKGTIPAGSLVAREGRKVRLAKPGDKIHGAVSASPMCLGGEGVTWSGRYARDEFGARIIETHRLVEWPALTEIREVKETVAGVEVVEVDGQRVERPSQIEHTRTVKVRVREAWSGLEAAAPTPIPSDAIRSTVDVPRPADGYDPGRVYVPRTQRPDDWTPVALVGQVRVRIGDGVHVDDSLAPGKDGLAVATQKPRGRGVEVMEITTPFDVKRGYGVALCMVG